MSMNVRPTTRKCWRGALAPVFAVVFGSCADSTGPIQPGDLAIVSGGELTSIAAVSLSRGQVVTRIGPMPAFKDMTALSPDSSRLYVSSFDNSSEVTLTAVDMRSLSIAYRESMSQIAARSPAGSVLPLGGYALAASPDGRALVMNGICTGQPCIVVVNLTTRTPTAVLNRFAVSPGGIVALASPSDSANQRVLVIGTRAGSTSSSPPPIYVLGGASLALVDSLLFPTSVNRLLPISSGAMAYGFSSDSIFKLDLVGQRVLARTPRPPSGSACSSVNGDRLYLMQPASQFDPGSGQVTVFDDALTQLSPIDLRSGGTTPTLNACAVSKGGSYLLVSSGTSSRGPQFGPQPGRLFVINRQLQAIDKLIDLGDWVSREVYAF